MNTVADKIIACRSGLIRRPWGYSVWIRSPRTGRTVTLSDGHLQNLPRLRSRVAQAMSLGRAVEFTLTELRIIAALGN